MADAPVTPDQVSLTLLAPGDAPALAELERRNREHLLVGAPLREESWFTEETQREAIVRAAEEGEAGHGLALAIRLTEHGATRLVGRLNLSGIVRGAFQSASLGYWVDDAVTGRGIATRAVQQAIAAAFGGLALHRLQAEVKVGNEASLHVLERCGFTEYGLAPSYLQLGGEWSDCRLLQLLDPDWRRQRPAARPVTDRTV